MSFDHGSGTAGLLLFQRAATVDPMVVKVNNETEDAFRKFAGRRTIVPYRGNRVRTSCDGIAVASHSILLPASQEVQRISMHSVKMGRAAFVAAVRSASQRKRYKINQCAT